MYINEDAVKSSKNIIFVEFVAGIAFVAFFVWLNLFVDMYSGYISFLDIFVFPWGIIILVCGIKRRLMHTKFESYRNLIGKKNVMSFIEIGKMVGRPAADVLRDFQWMNANNMFENTYLDSPNYQIYFGCYPFTKDKDAKKEVSKPTIAHICSFCCGVTIIEKGKDGICDWCRGPIVQEEGDN